MKKYLNKDLLKIIISLLLFILSFFIKQDIYKLIFLIPSYIIISYEMYIEAFKSIKRGEIFDENTLMIIATITAFFISSYIEAVLVMLLFQIGEYLSHLAVHKSRESITSLMDLRVEKANLLENNKVKVTKIENIKEGDILLIRPGEKIPLDGTIIEGETYLDTSHLTGESIPRKVSLNDSIMSGCINKEKVIKIKTTSTYKTSTSQRIIDLIEKSNDKKTNTETFIRKFARIYTPIVVIIAILLVIFPTLLGQDFHTWLYRALVFLVTSCPCALVISVPLGYFCGIGKASYEGILIKGSKELEKLSNIDYVMLDKTGTITEGVFEVTKIETNMDKKEFIKIIASIEENSIHPIAEAIKKKNKEPLEKVTSYKELPGMGIKCRVNKKEVLLGNKKLLEDNSIKVEDIKSIGTVIHLVINNEYKGYIVISDRIKPTSKNLNLSINKELIILSGDNEEITKEVAKETGIKKYYAELLPEDKVNYVKEYKKEGTVLFVGDGINDAPVIKESDIGASVGQLGSDAAIEASDIVLMQDDLTKIDTSIKIAKLTKRKVIESIIFALTVKILVLILGVFGISTILMAVLADVGVTFLVILNVLTIFLKKTEV